MPYWKEFDSFRFTRFKYVCAGISLGSCDMKLIRALVAVLAATVLAGCSLSSAGMVNLDPVPFSFHPPMGLESQLSVEPMTGQWADEAIAAGMESAVTVTYTPDEGQPAVLMGVYYMPEIVFDAAINPNEPPKYGTEVLRANSHVLAVAGPQDSMYDPSSNDGKNIGLLNEAIYKAENYMAK